MFLLIHLKIILKDKVVIAYFISLIFLLIVGFYRVHVGCDTMFGRCYEEHRDDLIALYLPSLFVFWTSTAIILYRFFLSRIVKLF
jgi:hypothetical protein